MWAKKMGIVSFFILLGIVLGGCGDEGRDLFVPSESSLEIVPDGEGMVERSLYLETRNGTSLSIPAGLIFLSEAEGPVKRPFVLTLKEKTIEEFEPLANGEWIGAVEISTDRPKETSENVLVVFGSIDPAHIEDYNATGFTLRVPLGKMKMPICEEVKWYYRPLTGDMEGWLLSGSVAVDGEGGISVDVAREGVYAFACVAPRSSRGEMGVFDLTMEINETVATGTIMETCGARVIWVWFYDPESGSSETGVWKRLGSEDTPAWGRLENYGHRLRIRSDFANKPSARLHSHEGHTFFEPMQGPFPVENGVTSKTPLADPYLHCEYEYAVEVELYVVSRGGDFPQFKRDIVYPLREKYEDAPVLISSFKKIGSGYVGVVRVITHDCTRKVVDATGILEKTGISLVHPIDGRCAFILDERGGTPYLAVPTKVDDGKAFGIDFLDPFPTQFSELIMPHHFLGGVDHAILFPLSMEYDSVHDQLWVIHSTRENPSFRIFRYDHPVYEGGDRAADVEIVLPEAAFSTESRLYLDPLHDRLYVRTLDPAEGQLFTVTVYDNVSTQPVKRMRATHYAHYFPNDPSSRNVLYAHAMFATETDLYLVDGNSYAATASGVRGMEIGRFPLSEGGNGSVTFEGWASIEGEDTTEGRGVGVYDGKGKILYFPRLKESGESVVYAIDDPMRWKSAWIDTGDDGYWAAVDPSYRSLFWSGSQIVDDIDFVRGYWYWRLGERVHGVMAVLESKTGSGPGTARVFALEDNASGKIVPAFIRGNDPNMRFCVELIDTPGP